MVLSKQFFSRPLADEEGMVTGLPVPSQPLQQAQSVFPSSICSAVVNIIHLLDDVEVNSDGVSGMKRPDVFWKKSKKYLPTNHALVRKIFFVTFIHHVLSFSVFLYLAPLIFFHFFSSSLPPSFSLTRCLSASLPPTLSLSLSQSLYLSIYLSFSFSSFLSPYFDQIDVFLCTVFNKSSKENIYIDYLARLSYQMKQTTFLLSLLIKKGYFFDHSIRIKVVKLNKFAAVCARNPIHLWAPSCVVEKSETDY